MKCRPLLLSSLLLTITLTSCRLTIIKDKTIDSTVYSLFGGEVESRDISYNVLDDKELLPYFTVSSYLSLFNKYLNSNYKIELSGTSAIPTVYVSNSESGAIFVASIDSNSQYVIENGDFSSVFTFSKDYSKSSLYVGNESNYEISYEPTTIREFSYRDMGFTTYRKNGSTYYPLSLLECIFSPYSGVHHLFNYSRILQYTDYEELTDTTYKINGEDITAFKEMKNFINNDLKVMPLYLREDRRASFLFTLENKYGLKYTRKISSMKKYLEKQDFYNDFLSEDNLKRNEAIYKTFALLDDGHTSIRDHADYPYIEGEFNQYGTKMSHILSIRKELSLQRQLPPGSVYYSTDEELAFFTFDSFSFAEQAYQEDGKTLKKDLSDY